ncbi:MAG: PDZ domain-containing protein [Planctomycetia bacterium]|nr:PDZ domain-containing protein [Planctomycetia bacterium]
MKNKSDFTQKNLGVRGKILFFGLFILMIGLGLFLSQSMLPAQATKQLKNPNPQKIEKNPVQNKTAPKASPKENDGAPDELKDLPFSENRKSYSVIIESKPGPDGKMIQTKKVWKNGKLTEETTETIDPKAGGNPSIQLSNGKNAQGHILRSERFGDLSINPGDDPAAMINELQKRLQDQHQFHMEQMQEMNRIFGGFPDDFPGSPTAPVAPAKLSKYWIGAAVHPVPEIVAAQLDLKDKGVIVVNIVPDSPAQKAGIIRFDVITAVNGTPITNGLQIGEILDQAEGKAIKIDYMRKGKAAQLDLTPAQRPDAQDPTASGIFSNDKNDEERSIRVVRPGLIVPSDSLNSPQKEKK